jgi:TetR/AcrR family transcriptional regulator, lmrAB and yxaGH operons repressor
MMPVIPRGQHYYDDRQSATDNLAMSAHPRERMIQSALILMGEQGVEGTSFSQVLEHSGAPRGSIYHHFPGGKEQLIEEATHYAGDVVVKLLTDALERHEDPTAAVEEVVQFWRTILYDSNFAAGCPVIAAALESERAPAARVAAKEAFERWEELYAVMLQRAGLPEERARSLGSIAIAAVEGAVILSRAEGSNRPLERVGDELERLFRDAIEDVRTR